MAADFVWYRSRTVDCFSFVALCGCCLNVATPPPPSGELSLLLRGYEDNMQETRSVTLLAQNA